jgi:hypothetical protein
VTGYELNGRASNTRWGKDVLFSRAPRPALWGPPSLLLNRYRGLFPRV